MFTPQEYRKYQESLHWLVKSLNLTPGDYAHLEVIFFIPGKENGILKRTRPDTDNYTKAIKDIFEKAKVLKRLKADKKGYTSDDSMIASEHALKITIDDPIGGIYFMLMTEQEYFAKYGNPADIFKRSQHSNSTPRPLDVEG
jgi:Holliday junction resolvase RusA-like endonuclease